MVREVRWIALLPMPREALGDVEMGVRISHRWLMLRRAVDPMDYIGTRFGSIRQLPCLQVQG